MSRSIDPATHMGAVRLTVADLDRARSFYRRALGLAELAPGDGIVRLGPPAGPALVELVAAPDAPERPRRSTGLFHLAVLVPGRAELARALRRVLDAGASFTGASDHLVSEALYLDDPEGNGIEIYRDRPRAEWTREGGELAHGHPAARRRGGRRRDAGRRPTRGWPRGRPWGTSTCRCATSPRPRRSGRASSASSPRSAVTREPSSSRRAATTTTSG